MDIYPVRPYSFGANTYIVYSGTHAFVIDPCVSMLALTSAAEQLGVTVEGILLTHGHFDHTVSIDRVRDALGIPAYVHVHDAVMLTDSKKNAYFDFCGKECTHLPAERILHEGDSLTLGDEALKVIHTPGHTGGCVCYLSDDFIVTGDTLFADSVGRCDLWSGDSEVLRTSLARLRTLPRTLKLYAGHGEPSTLGMALDNSAYYL